MPEIPKYKINLADKKPSVLRTESSVGRKSRVFEISLEKRRNLFDRLFGISPKKGTLYRRERITQEQLDILKFAKENGISVEVPISYTLGKSKDMLFLSSGKELSPRLFKMASIKRQEHFFQQLLDIFVSLHKNNISHNHPHLGNFVLDSVDKVTLVDFKHAKRKVVDWKNSQEIYHYFVSDYVNLIQLSMNLGLTELNTKALLSKLISSYSATSGSKKKVYEAVLRIIENQYNP